MRICRLSTRLDPETGLPVLIREKGVNCPVDSLRTPEQVVDMLNNVFHHADETEEIVYLLALNAKNRLIGVFELSHGAVDLSILNPREAMMKLLLCNAVSLIIAHNHPSGDPEPSKSDTDSTGRLQQACSIIGIKFLDSIVIGSNGAYFSFRYNKML